MTDAVISAHARDGQLATRSSAPPLDRNGNQRSWEDVRNAVRELYEHGEHHRTMAAKLNLTRIQLHTQLRRLFREGLAKR